MIPTNYYINTPLFKSHQLNKQYGLDVSYKMDCYQPSGSFKIRGMDNFLKELSKQGYKKVIASSGGNAGYSLAYVGQQMGISLRLIVPVTTSDYMIAKIKLLGAEVEVYGANWNEANDYALQIAKEFDLPYVHPFDHPFLWKGHSSIIDECALEMTEPDRIIVAVGGGGLLCGVFEGLLRNNWLKVKVVTAETEGAASFAKSIEAGHLIELEEINTIATSLGAKKVATQSLEYASQFNVEPYVTDDKSAFNACKDFFNEYHTLVESACGAALSYVRNNHSKINPKEKILVIVCGGVSMGMEKYLAYSKQYQ
ncbi:MAG: pyridoxal-phosphate dependent enzyme [Cyclobacteriaceae bacterium]